MRVWFAEIFPEIFYGAFDMLASELIADNGAQGALAGTSFPVIMIHNGERVVNNLEAVFPEAAAPIDILEIHEGAFPHRSDFLNGHF